MGCALPCKSSKAQELVSPFVGLMPLSKKQVIAKLTQKASSWLNGSGDPEVHDALDASKYLSGQIHDPDAKQGMKLRLLEFERKVVALVPGGCILPEPLTTVPVPDAEPTRVCLASYQLGCEARHRITGRAKNVRVLEVFVEMAEKPFDSKSNPLQIELPAGAAVGSPVADFDVGYFAGLTRSLAAQLLLRALMDASEEDLGVLLMEAVALLRVHAVLMPTMSPADRVNATIASKMSATERLRQDPSQLLRAFEARASAEGRDLADCLQSYMEEHIALQSCFQIALQSLEIVPPAQQLWCCRAEVIPCQLMLLLCCCQCIACVRNTILRLCSKARKSRRQKCRPYWQ